MSYLDRVEDVHEYPRPPRLEPVDAPVAIWLDDERIAHTTGALRVLETTHPPTLYLPPSAFVDGILRPVPGAASTCEWKGRASYFDVGDVSRAAWSYAAPDAPFEPLAGFVAVYPGRMQRCTIDGEVVAAQPGDFYGGWITSNLRGPFKGAPGTLGW